jgi:hypothetical protein
MPLNNEVDLNSKRYFIKRKSAMLRERESFIKHYIDLQRDIKPRRGQFLGSNTKQANSGTKRHQNIINSAGTQAHDIATSGMYNGIMSPARPWFKLTTMEPAFMEFQSVKLWLSAVQRVMLQIFNRGNLYDMAPQMIGEEILFATGCMLHVEDTKDVARFYTQTAGSYLIAQNNRLEVDTFCRDLEYTAWQMSQEFPDPATRSINVNTAIERGEYDRVFKVMQFVDPNPSFNESKALFNSKFKAYRSVYLEESEEGPDDKKFLKISGFDEFPVYAPRWDVTGNDTYGTDCPAMVALGDIRQLQIEEKRKAQAIDKVVNPPLGGPASLKNVPISALPGGVNIYNASNNAKLEPIYQINPAIGELRQDMAEVENRINKAFFVDMFLAISNMQGIQPKNQLELSQRNEERLLQLGPTIQRFQREFLDKLIDRTFNQADRRGMIPEPPREIAGAPLKVEFVSTLAMAQLAVKTQDIDRLVNVTGGLVSLGFEDAAMKLDAGQVVDEYANALGTPPGVVRPDDVVAEMKEAQAKAAQEQQALEHAESLSKAMKNTGDTIDTLDEG